MNKRDFFIYVDGQKLTYEVSATRILVKSETLDITGMRSMMPRAYEGNLKNVHDLNNQLFMIDMQDTGQDDLLELHRYLNDKEDVLYTSPVLLDETGREIGGFTNQVFVRIPEHANFSMLETVLNHHIKTAYRIKSIRPCHFDERTYRLTLEKGAEKDAMQVANEIHETSLFEYAEPNLIHFLQLSTNDTYFAQQWGLKNTGQSGGTANIDIKAEQAWTITTGLSTVRVAVLDRGVDLNHPDLVNRLSTGYDATGGGSGGAPSNTDGFAHGTICAGIIAAQANNGIGIAGVAYNCRILPVRVATVSSGWSTTESGYVADAITWARQTGAADIISMSFHCGQTSTLNTAISNAITSGRNNKGCVLVAASGNNLGSSVGYPGSNPNVIAVGAIDRTGVRPSLSSYGSDLDVVAPGVDIYSTSMVGSGYPTINDGANGVYTYNVKGTSLSCPHVSGIAALILSIRPSLTAAQVRHIIQFSCTKLSGYTFSNNSAHPSGTWNNQVGHGLVNAYASLSLLSITRYISRYSGDTSGGSTIYASGGYAGVTLSLDPTATGLTYTWSAEFYGQCNRWYIWPSGSSVDVSVYVDPGQGGTLRILCEIYAGSLLLTSAYYYLDVLQ
jgi:subtilisin family serine protease